MNERNINIPSEAVESAGKSDKMRNVRRRQFIARWGFRAGVIAGLYDVRDTAYDEAINYLTTFQINDLRTLIILELTGLALISSRIVNYHFEKQKNAIRINNINRAINSEFPEYNPSAVPEGYIDQYRDSVKKVIETTRRFKI